MTCAFVGASRSLHWERGLKQAYIRVRYLSQLSLPSLGAWIETPILTGSLAGLSGRSLHWERGLKLSQSHLADVVNASRSLHWERGLKHNRRNKHRIIGCRSLHWERGLKHGQRSNRE